MRRLVGAVLLLSTAHGVLVSKVDAQSLEEIVDYIHVQSARWGADPHLVMRIANCESKMNPYDIGGSGERGLGQWLPGGHWYRTPAWNPGIEPGYDEPYDIVLAYRLGDPDAWKKDIEMLAWSFSPRAPAGFRNGWSCWRLLPR